MNALARVLLRAGIHLVQVSDGQKQELTALIKLSESDKTFRATNLT